MWDYSDRRDLTRISSDELREAEIDECVHAIMNIKKKSPVLKIFGAVACNKAFPCTEVCLCSWSKDTFVFCLCWLMSNMIKTLT
jgi:hypothetical protein